MDDENIKLLITLLNEKMEYHKRQHETAIREIRQLCPHNEVGDVLLVGKRRCLICGEFLD